jgi:hypothetical protein
MWVSQGDWRLLVFVVRFKVEREPKLLFASSDGPFFAANLYARKESRQVKMHLPDSFFSL